MKSAEAQPTGTPDSGKLKQREVTPEAAILELIRLTDRKASATQARSKRIAFTGSDDHHAILSKLVQDLVDTRNADASTEFECVVTAAVNRRWDRLEEHLNKHKQEVSDQLNEQKRQVTEQTQQLAAQKQQLAAQEQRISQLTTEVKHLSSTAKAASDAPAPAQNQWRDIVAKDVRRQVSKEVVKLSVDEKQREERKLELCFFGVNQVEGEDALEVMQELVDGTLEAEVKLESAVRLQGKETSQKEGVSKPRPVIVKLHSVEDKVALLKLGHKLKAANSAVKMQMNFTKSQQQHRSACWPEFIKAKEAGQKCQWRDEKLFVNGKQHIPPM